MPQIMPQVFAGFTGERGGASRAGVAGPPRGVRQPPGALPHQGSHPAHAPGTRPLAARPLGARLRRG